MNPGKCDPESLQKPLAPAAAAARPREPEPFPWLPGIAFLFLTFNCVQAIYRSRGDPWTVSFVVSAYSSLLLLFWCLRQLERLPRDGTHASKEKGLKVGVWALAMFLNVIFSYRVAAMMPPALAAVIWAVAGSTTVAAFYAFFVYREPAAAAVVPPSKG